MYLVFIALIAFIVGINAFAYVVPPVWTIVVASNFFFGVSFLSFF